MVKQQVNTVFAKIASEMHTILGPMKVLSSENPKTADELYRRLVEAVGELDAIVCVYLRHFCFHVMEIERLQGFKRDILRSAYENWIAERIADLQHALALIERKSTEGDKAPYEAKIEALKQKQPTELDYAGAFTRCLPVYERIERLIISAEMRRDNALREMENWQAGFGRRVSALSDQIIEGEFDEQPDLVSAAAAKPGAPPIAAPGRAAEVPDEHTAPNILDAPDMAPVDPDMGPAPPLPLFDHCAAGTEGAPPSSPTGPSSHETAERAAAAKRLDPARQQNA